MTIKYSVILKFIPSILLMAIGFLLKNGLLVELSVNWILLLLIEKNGLTVLGLLPTGKRTIQLLVGFGIAIAICFLNFYLQTIFSGSTWSFNKSFTLSKFFAGSWWIMQSVLYEEFIFRGALLYIAIKKIGVKKACLLSALCFGVYHLFSMNAFGNLVLMSYLFIGTGIAGYLFARAYAKTNSLYLPIGLHFGWDFITTLIFSKGPLGNQLLILKRGVSINLIENIIVILVQFAVFPLLAFWYIKTLKSNKDEQLLEPTMPATK